MIPKRIHYCWFGGKEKPYDVQHYINTWKNHLYDYEIIEWNETNFDVSNSPLYVKEAYENKKWSFVSDYVRLNALFQYGGIYLDTDVEVFKSFDELLNNEVFVCFESNDSISTAVIGAVPNNKFIKEFMEYYNRIRFVKENGEFNLQTNVSLLTKMLLKDGLEPNGAEQTIQSIRVFPQYYFSDNNIINIFGKYSAKNYAYHHYNASWQNKNHRNGIHKRLRHYLLVTLRNCIGTDSTNKLGKVIKGRK